MVSYTYKYKKIYHRYIIIHDWYHFPLKDIQLWLNWLWAKKKICRQFAICNLQFCKVHALPPLYKAGRVVKLTCQYDSDFQGVRIFHATLDFMYRGYFLDWLFIVHTIFRYYFITYHVNLYTEHTFWRYATPYLNSENLIYLFSIV